jgi:hypothetical protein
MAMADLAQGLDHHFYPERQDFRAHHLAADGPKLHEDFLSLFRAKAPDQLGLLEVAQEVGELRLAQAQAAADLGSLDGAPFGGHQLEDGGPTGSPQNPCNRGTIAPAPGLPQESLEEEEGTEGLCVLSVEKAAGIAGNGRADQDGFFEEVLARCPAQDPERTVDEETPQRRPDRGAPLRNRTVNPGNQVSRRILVELRNVRRLKVTIRQVHDRHPPVEAIILVFLLSCPFPLAD